MFICIAASPSWLCRVLVNIHTQFVFFWLGYWVKPQIKKKISARLMWVTPIIL
jgi:hypothetical protein